MSNRNNKCNRSNRALINLNKSAIKTLSYFNGPKTEICPASRQSQPDGATSYRTNSRFSHLHGSFQDVGTIGETMSATVNKFARSV